MSSLRSQPLLNLKHNRTRLSCKAYKLTKSEEDFLLLEDGTDDLVLVSDKYIFLLSSRCKSARLISSSEQFPIFHHCS